MVQPRIGQSVVVDVPATSANIGPGFDCLGAALDLNNRFTMRRIEGDGERFELIIEGQEGSHLRVAPTTSFIEPPRGSGKQLVKNQWDSKRVCVWRYPQREGLAVVPQQSWQAWWEPMHWSESP